MRRFLAKKHVAAYRSVRTRAAIVTQKRYRGYLVRRRMAVTRAGRRIFKFVMKLRFFRFRDGIVTTIQLRKMFRRRFFAAVLLQKMVRGKLVRLRFHYVRLRHFVTHRASRAIVRILRLFMVQRARRRDESFVYPDDAWARRHLSKKLATLLWEKMQGWRGRRALAERFEQAAPSVQMLVRGSLARRGVKRVRWAAWLLSFLLFYMSVNLYIYTSILLHISFSLHYQLLSS